MKDENLWAIIAKYDMPRPIYETEAIGKTVKEITTGTWVHENVYIVFTDNTCISFGKRSFFENPEIYVLSPDQYGFNYIVDFGYGKDSRYHEAYEEYLKLSKKAYDEQLDAQERQEFQRLKKKYDSLRLQRLRSK